MRMPLDSAGYFKTEYMQKLCVGPNTKKWPVKNQIEIMLKSTVFFPPDYVVTVRYYFKSD